MAEEYSEYKHMKAKLRLLEVLISKRGSSQTVWCLKRPLSWKGSLNWDGADRQEEPTIWNVWNDQRQLPLWYHKVALEINVYIAQLDLTGSFIL